jgi:hypothetical protein
MNAVKARLILRNIAPVLERHNNLVFDDGLLFFTPIGYYVRGCSFQIGRAGTYAFVSRFVCPLFEGNGFLHVTWGKRLSNAMGGQGWDFDSPDFAEEFPRRFETVIAPAVIGVTDGRAFLHYIETEDVDGRWFEYGRALAHLHMGNLAVAKHEFDAFLDRWDEDGFGRPTHVETARKIRKMIEHDPAGLDAFMRDIAAAEVKAAKLEKYWVAPKSFFDGPINTSGV